MQRIEIELQPGQQCQAAGGDDTGDHEDRAPMPHEEPVERGERDVPDSGALAGWMQKREQRRQQRDVGDERHDHPRSGDHTQLRHPAVLGRHERVEPCGRRGGRKGQGSADLLARVAQRDV